MAKQILNTGTSNNDKTGDTLRAGGLKIKANFDEIYNALGNGTNITGGNLLKTGSWTDVQNKPTFATVAASGSYDDLTDKPAVLIQAAVPETLSGSSGDMHGMIAYDGSSLYVCTESYTDGVNDIWKTIPWDGGTANTGQFTFVTDTVTVAGDDMKLRTTRTGFDIDADVDIVSADDVWIEAAGDDVGISAANDVSITTNTSNMHPTNWSGQEDSFVGTWNGTTLTLTVPNGETTLITLLNYYTNLGNAGDIWLKTASGYVQTQNTDPADKTIGTGETVFEIPLLASSPVANADIIRMKLYDSINGDLNKQWTFTKNGKLEFPNGGTIEPVGMGWIGLTNGTTGTPVSLVNRYSTDGLERSMLTLNGDVEGGSINLLAVNATGESDVYHNWQFNDNASLTLPAGGIVSEGVVTSNPTIQFTPASPDVASQKLVIKGGGAYTYTDNGISINYYNNTALVGDTLTFYINSPAYANQTLYWWIYPQGANISDPGSGTVALSDSSGSFSFVLDSDDNEFTVRVSPEADNYDPANVGVETGLINPDAPTFDSEHHLHLTTGDLTETSIFLGTDDHNVRTTVNGGIEITTPNTSNNVWGFDANGILTFPDGTTNSGATVIAPNVYSIQSIGNTLIQTSANAGAKTWAFGTDGGLTFPDSTVQSTAWAGGRVVTVPASSIGAIGDKSGDIAFSNGYIYYCTANYVGDSISVTTLASSGTTAWIDSADYAGDLVADFTATSTGWTYNGVTITAVSVDNTFGPGYALTGTTGFSVINGNNYTLVSPVALPDIWKRVAWSNDTW